MPPDFVELLTTISRIIEFVLVVGTVIGFFCRSWIREWIKARFTKAVNNELESYKHTLNRDLEAYKMALIADLEHRKANIDIQKAIALKMAEARLDAIRDLYSQLDQLCLHTLSWVTRYTPNLRQHSIEEYNKSNRATSEAFRATGIFMPRDLCIRIASAMAAGSSLVADFPVTSAETIPSDNPRINSIVAEFISCGIELRNMLVMPPSGIPDIEQQEHIRN